MAKFKEGDRVRLISTPHLNIRGPLVGDTGTVIEDSYVPFVSWDTFRDGAHVEPSWWCVPEDELELEVLP